MKGIELPINVIIIILIALIVLVAIIALFTEVWQPGVGGISLESAKSTACQKLVSTQCLFDTKQITTNGFDANHNGTINTGTNWDWNTKQGDDNLAALCYNYYSITSENPCKQLCSC